MTVSDLLEVASIKRKELNHNWELYFDCFKQFLVIGEKRRILEGII